MQIEVILRIRKRPAEGEDIADMPIDEIRAAGDSYVDALASAQAAVPEGWQMLSIGRW